MVVQRFDKKWQAFVDVDYADQINSGDRLTVVPKVKPLTDATTSAATICRNVGNPKGPTARVLSTLFRTGRGRQTPRERRGQEISIQKQSVQWHLRNQKKRSRTRE